MTHKKVYPIRFYENRFGELTLYAWFCKGLQFEVMTGKEARLYME